MLYSSSQSYKKITLLEHKHLKVQHKAIMLIFYKIMLVKSNIMQ